MAEDDFGLASGVAGASVSVEDSGGGENLGPVADGGDGFLGGMEGSHEVEHLGIKAEIFGGSATWDDECIVVFGLYLSEIGIEHEAMARFLAVGLVSFEVMDGGGEMIARFLSWADDVAGMADHEQHLVGDHEFIVLDKIASEEEDALGCHEERLQGEDGCTVRQARIIALGSRIARTQRWDV